MVIILKSELLFVWHFYLALYEQRYYKCFKQKDLPFSVYAKINFRSVIMITENVKYLHLPFVEDDAQYGTKESCNISWMFSASCT